jgi:hypothetical protein
MSMRSPDEIHDVPADERTPDELYRYGTDGPWPGKPLPVVRVGDGSSMAGVADGDDLRDRTTVDLTRFLRHDERLEREAEAFRRYREADELVRGAFALAVVAELIRPGKPTRTERVISAILRRVLG